MSSRNQELQANYDALMALPLVQQLVKQNKKLSKKNKKLSKRNKCLENLIYSLPEFRKNCCCDSSCGVVQRKESVHIKIEPGCEIADEDDDVVSSIVTPVKPNIQYEIVEAEEEAEEEEEAEAEEEEAEAEEEEAEAEEEEVFEVTIKGKGYYTTNETDGVIYAIASNEDVGDTVGHFVKGKPVFY